MKIDLTRRDFLRVGGAAAALTALPPFLRRPRGEGFALALGSGGRFFDGDQYAAIDAAVARLIPDDVDPATGMASPGAGPARVVDYVDRFLGAFDVAPGKTPFLYAGGPSSDRNPAPQPDFCGGTPIPPNGPQLNGMATPAPLSRRRAIAWRARILGTAALGDEARFIRDNNRVLGRGDANGDLPGLQELYGRGIGDLNDFSKQLFGADFKDLDPIEQDVALNLLPNQDFVNLLFEHTVEGMYANPEYGGNQPENGGTASGADGPNRPLGWKYIGYEGDRQPLGYSIFVPDADDPNHGAYCELPEHPVSEPNPGIDPMVLDPGVIAQLPELVVRVRIRGAGR